MSALLVVTAACNDRGDERADGSAAAPAVGSEAGVADAAPLIPHPTGSGGTAGPPPGPPPAFTGDAAVPEDFTVTEVGGFMLGEAVTGETTLGPQAAGGCSTLIGVVRDFRGLKELDGHPDFEAFEGKGPTPGLLAAELGSDAKPVYASVCEATNERGPCPYGQMTTSIAAFDQWYRSVPDVNLPFVLYLAFQPNDGVFTFQSAAFFPLDDAGWGNGGGKRQHNFGFTTEVHTRFVYRGEETFSFTGDDDLWVFIDGKLAIALGGLHPPATGTVELDAIASDFGLTPGETYALDLFHAERHSASSNFRVDTTLSFTSCGSLGPD